MLKNLFLLLFALLIVSCKSTQPSIITSKNEAIKKNKYDGNLNIRVVKVDKVTQKEKVEPIAQKNKNSETNQQTNVVLNNTDDVDIHITCDDSNYLIDQLIYASYENIGSPYKTGGTSKSGFDCSGLMVATFKNYNISLPRTSSEMSRIGYIVNASEAKKGDLIFFKTNGRSQINHVGLVVEVNGEEIKFIHSSVQKGVIVSSTNETYYKKAYALTRRVIN
jgi:cell wall-associated NlpC family hydrolase